jgi:pilus assembly protein CpaF
MSFLLTVTSPDGDTQELHVAASTALIGRAPRCDVLVSGWRVAREHARLHLHDGSVTIEDLGGMAGTLVNGARVERHGPLQFSDEIAIGGYKLRVQNRPGAAASPERSSPAAEPSAESAMFPVTPAPASAGGAEQPDCSPNPDDSERFEWRKQVHEQLLDTIDLRRRDLTRMSDRELRDETGQLIREIVATLGATLPPRLDRDRLIREVLDEAVGLGPLEDLLGDESVTEVMVNRHDQIFIERAGRLLPHPTTFTSDRAVMGVIERIVAPLGRRIDEASPMVDARLKDGSRVNAIIPPLAIKGPTLTIRKFATHKLSAPDLVACGSISSQMVTFLDVCVRYRKNIIVSGGTGSGKTTFLNVLSNFIPDGERIVTIEDAAELRLNHSHLVSLEARPSNVEGRGAVSIRDLVKNSLRMRPDRIVVGECRSGEALDMLQAMNTGHEGSLTTLHANTPRDALARLETLVLMAGMDLPLTAIREQIASAVDIIVQQTRFGCGSRKVTSITEVTGMENSRIQLQELFRFESTGYAGDGRVQGAFAGCDACPTFYEELRARGAALDLSIFRRQPA